MATATKVQLTSGIEPQYPRNVTDSTSSSSKTSQLLQDNHENFDIFFNDSGFHNHIAHHLLTLWALGATTEQVQRQFDVNKGMQRPSGSLTRPSIVPDLHDPQQFLAHIGPRNHYADFLQFFTSEIATHGWPKVLQKYLFAGDAVAETMFVRLHSGFLHPLIHLGFGVEFAQPAIVAEALAEAACHDAWIGDLLIEAEKRAAAAAANANAKEESIVSLLAAARADPALLKAPHWDDDNKVRDGIIVRAKEEMIALLARVHRRPRPDADAHDEAFLEAGVAEMTNAVAYYSAGSQFAGKAEKFDFYFIHCVNSSIFYPAFLRQSWLRTEDKIRLLEYKIRMDLVLYVSRKSPAILEERFRAYEPRDANGGWEAIEARVCALDDDGHAPKLVRALANGQAICKRFEEGNEAFPLKQADWLKLGHMAIDSVEASGPTWVRSAGFEEAWREVPAKL